MKSQTACRFDAWLCVCLAVSRIAMTAATGVPGRFPLSLWWLMGCCDAKADKEVGRDCSTSTTSLYHHMQVYLIVIFSSQFCCLPICAHHCMQVMYISQIIALNSNALQAQRQELKEAAMENMQDDIAREVDARRKQLQVIPFVWPCIGRCH